MVITRNANILKINTSLKKDKAKLFKKPYNQ